MSEAWFSPTFDRESLLEEAARIADRFPADASALETVRAEEPASLLLRDLRAERAQFGPRPEIYPIDTAALTSQGRGPDERVKGLIARNDFFGVVFTVALFPRPGWVFHRLSCEVEFASGAGGPPVAFDIYPATEWETLAKANLHLEVGISAASLEFRTQNAIIPGGSASVQAKVDPGATFVFPPRDYLVKQAKIVSGGRDSSVVSWRLDDAEYISADEPQFGIILKVPKGFRPGQATARLEASRHFNYLGARLGDLFNHLTGDLLKFFQAGTPLTHQIEWDLAV